MIRKKGIEQAIFHTMIPWRDVDEIPKGPGGSKVDVDDFLSEPYVRVGEMEWVRREVIVDSEQEDPLMRGSRSECKSTVDVMTRDNIFFDGLEHVLLVAE